MDVLLEASAILCLLGLTLTYLIVSVRGAVKSVDTRTSTDREWTRACWNKLFPRLAVSLSLISVLMGASEPLFFLYDYRQAPGILVHSILFWPIVSMGVAAVLCVIAQYAGPERAWRRIVQIAVGLFLGTFFLLMESTF